MCVHVCVGVLFLRARVCVWHYFALGDRRCRSKAPLAIDFPRAAAAAAVEAKLPAAGLSRYCTTRCYIQRNGRDKRRRANLGRVKSD